jgi:Glycosyltransferase family 87
VAAGGKHLSFHSKLIAAKVEIAICALGVVLNIALACNLFLPNAWAGRNDFLGFYAGTRLAGTGNLYNRDRVREEQLKAVGESGEIQYGRLPAYAMALKPLGWLPYRAAYAAWEVLLTGAFLAFLILWPSPAPFRRWFIGCWSLPAFIALFNGQDDLLLLLPVALSARLLRAGKSFAAGMVLGLFAASKYHLFTMVPLILVAQRRWRMFAGAALSGCCLLGASFAVEGRGWPAGLYSLLTDSRVSTGLNHMPNLHSLLAGAPFSLFLQIAASLLLATGVYLAAHNSFSFESALGLALGAGVLIGYHGYVHDGALFLPALIAFSGAAAAYARIPAILLITPIPWCILHLTKPFPVLAQLLLLTCVVGGIAWLAGSPQFSKADKIAVS